MVVKDNVPIKQLAKEISQDVEQRMEAASRLGKSDIVKEIARLGDHLSVGSETALFDASYLARNLGARELAVKIDRVKELKFPLRDAVLGTE